MGQNNSAEDIDVGQLKEEEDGETQRLKFMKSLPEDFTERFEVLEEIGKGSFGRVYKVVDVKTKNVYAAKQLKYDTSNLKEARELFYFTA